MPANQLTKAAVYERRVPVAIDRVWENVFDYEHLPWLHGSSFAEIRCYEKGEWGWRAELRQTAYPDRLSKMEVLVDAKAQKYVSRLLEGFGAGTEIWTYLKPVGETTTDVRVEFNLPIADKAKAMRAGEAYKTLYAKLWDEDLVMMEARQDFLARNPKPSKEPVVLGTLREVKARLPLTVTLGEERFRVVEVKGKLAAFSCLCPHMQGRLDEGPLVGSEVTCPWHGYTFDVLTRQSTDGHKIKLRPAPSVVVDTARDEVRLEWPKPRKRG